MAEKKKTANKAAKAKPATKAKPQPKSIDWDSVSEPCVIVGKESKHLAEGMEYKVGKSTAKHLVEKGVATLRK